MSCEFSPSLITNRPEVLWEIANCNLLIIVNGLFQKEISGDFKRRYQEISKGDIRKYQKEISKGHIRNEEKSDFQFFISACSCQHAGIVCCFSAVVIISFLFVCFCIKRRYQIFSLLSVLELLAAINCYHCYCNQSLLSCYRCLPLLAASLAVFQIRAQAASAALQAESSNLDLIILDLKILNLEFRPRFDNTREFQPFENIKAH